MPKPNSSHTGRRRRNRGRSKRAVAPELSQEVREEIENIIGYKFNDNSLLDRAFTHSSAVPGNAARHSNERLEFLGDRVLGLVVAGQLIHRFELEREGGLAPRLNALVNRVTCANVIRALELGPFIIRDYAAAPKNQENQSMLADLAESVIGAIYLDGGLPPSEEFILNNWKQSFKSLTDKPSDPKSKLQEWSQGRGKPAPEYQEEARSGPDHQPIFTTKVSIDGFPPVSGKGNSKQESEQEAAKKLLEQIGNTN